MGGFLEVSLTAKEIEEKIKQVEKDIQTLNSAGETGRKFEVLNEYKSYLEDELHFIKNNH